jgi:hypothetical protein
MSTVIIFRSYSSFSMRTNKTYGIFGPTLIHRDALPDHFSVHLRLTSVYMRALDVILHMITRVASHLLTRSRSRTRMVIFF